MWHFQVVICSFWFLHLDLTSVKRREAGNTNCKASWLKSFKRPIAGCLGVYISHPEASSFFTFHRYLKLEFHMSYREKGPQKSCGPTLLFKKETGNIKWWLRAHTLELNGQGSNPDSIMFCLRNWSSRVSSIVRCSQL